MLNDLIKKTTTKIRLSILTLSFYFIFPYSCFSATYLENEQSKTQKHDFYLSLSCGRTILHNAQDILDSIKKLCKSDIKDRYPAVELFFGHVLTSIDKCEAKTDFQWLGSMALGYYIRNNGRFEFEAAYFQGIIKSNSKHLKESLKALHEVISIEKSLLKNVDTINCSGKIGMYTIMPNLYYNPSIKNTSFAPYIGFGVGLMGAKLIFDQSDDNKERKSLKLPWIAYQVKLGFNYSLTQKAKMSFGYRYFNIPLPIVSSIASHNVEVGIIFYF
ncbi:MAG: P44/Msp2 family outer membrane protein [Wolbachia sp.]|nr:P44/Msp2 family outer membrane protein [Wolbachia sp.]MDD9336328.1 P44/Msp2 family outer membrane protein [Wolbachia sp.]